MAEGLVEEALREVQAAVKQARRSRGASELDLVKLGKRVPSPVLADVEQVAREQDIYWEAIVATVGVRLRGHGGDAQANEQALPFLEAAAELDDAMAANTAGLATLDLGRREQAYAWFIKGAEGGDPQAQCNLGSLYLDDGDLSNARRWLEKSNDPRAAGLLRRLDEAEHTKNAQVRSPQRRVGF